MKKWYLSKTLWVNVLMGATMFIDSNGNVLPISAEQQILIVSGINILLRLITTKQLTK